jgi:hypothetical protein
LAALALVVVQTSDDPRVSPSGRSHVRAVPSATLELSRALAAAPAAFPQSRGGNRGSVPPGTARQIAERYETRVPYPPGRRDTFAWDGFAGSLTDRWTIENLVVFRAACIWERYWLDARAAGGTGAARASAAVLADVDRWPTIKGGGGSAPARYRRIAAAAAAGDRVVVENLWRGDCYAVP